MVQVSGRDPTTESIQCPAIKRLSLLLSAESLHSAPALAIATLVTAPVPAQGDQQDHGTKPWVVNIEELTTNNQNFRTTWWTGKQLQMTVMSIQPGEDIGLEVHQKGDQFIRVEEGTARVQMGTSKTNLSYDKTVGDDWAMFIPEGYWHNISNAGNEELKVYVL